MKSLLSASFKDEDGIIHTMESKFPAIVSLNISDNPIEDISATIDEIVTLMPNIRDLQMSLYKEEHVNLVIQRLSKL